MLVHVELFSQLSQPLRALIESEMREKHERNVEFPDVEPDVFIALYEYASTGDYSCPPADFSQGHQNLSIAMNFDETILAEPVDAKCNACEVEPAELSYDQCYAPNPDFPPTVEDDAIAENSGFPSFGTTPKLLKKNKKKARYQFHWHEPLESTKFTDLREDFAQQAFPKREWTLTYTSAEKNILFHAKLFCLAEEYLIEPLQDLCLDHLHQDLASLELDCAKAMEILELASFTYLKRSRQGSRGEDGLRKLVSLYIASHCDVFRQLVHFRSLLDANGEIGSDLVHLLSH